MMRSISVPLRDLGSRPLLKQHRNNRRAAGLAAMRIAFRGLGESRLEVDRKGTVRGPREKHLTLAKLVVCKASRKANMAGTMYAFSLPTKADKVPASTEWIHEIKHAGYRMC